MGRGAAPATFLLRELPGTGAIRKPVGPKRRSGGSGGAPRDARPPALRPAVTIGDRKPGGPRLRSSMGSGGLAPLKSRRGRRRVRATGQTIGPSVRSPKAEREFGALERRCGGRLDERPTELTGSALDKRPPPPCPFARELRKRRGPFHDPALAKRAETRRCVSMCVWQRRSRHPRASSSGLTGGPIEAENRCKKGRRRVNGQRSSGQAGG